MKTKKERIKDIIVNELDNLKSDKQRLTKEILDPSTSFHEVNRINNALKEVIKKIDKLEKEINE